MSPEIAREEFWRPCMRVHKTVDSVEGEPGSNAILDQERGQPPVRSLGDVRLENDG